MLRVVASRLFTVSTAMMAIATGICAMMWGAYLLLRLVHAIGLLTTDGQDIRLRTSRFWLRLPARLTGEPDDRLATHAVGDRAIGSHRCCWALTSTPDPPAVDRQLSHINYRYA